MAVVDKADNLGFYTTDSKTKVEVKAEPPFPGDQPATNDLFILRASFLGYVSRRHSKQGTWLIRALVYALYTYACDKDIQSIFEEVKEIVKEEYIGY
ncbi:hypothetical protein EB796_009483 [Bugula neritina]|uniref:Caspase family p10 domain-containing protein n=1 Tax=Bugula neritina TaxID=10212 RepID=A0A7J7K3P8_BUGNE|nr:hypothetical protein EB796_009483 [Bugula neritina]